MLNRRKFLWGALSTGLVLGCGATLSGCSGVKRASGSGVLRAAHTTVQLKPQMLSILYHAGLAPSSHNCQPWHARIVDANRWIIQADSDRRLPAVDSQNRELMLSLGAFAENLSLAAGAMGMHAEIQVMADQRDDRDVMQVVLHKDVSTDYPLTRITMRRTVRQGQLPKNLSAADVRILSNLADGQLHYFAKGSKHAACLQEAAVESFRIQSSRDDAQLELTRWLRLSDADARKHRDGLTTEGMEIGGAAGWFMRHFAEPADFLKASYRNQGNEKISKLAGQGGGWMVITSPGEAVSDLIETGRRFERMALMARELGIGIHPMTQILEEEYGRSLIADNHKENFFPQFVLRVGYLDKYPEPVSLRRPIGSIISNAMKT